MKDARVRAIVDTDAKNEADDQFAIVQALLSPSIDVRGLVAAHFGTHRTNRSMEESRDEIDLLLRLTRLDGSVRVENGARSALPDETTPMDSAGAQLIIEESKLASADDKLYVAFLGPLTDMASAILLDPELAQRPVVVIWIGGLPYDDRHPWPGIEFNLGNDIAAANVVFDSGIEIWQVPCNVYSQVSVSYVELEDQIGGTSELADYLIRQLVEWNERYCDGPIESRSLGDSPAVSLMLFPAGGDFRHQPAPRFAADGTYEPGAGHPVRVAERVDVRFLIGDLFAKLRRFGRTLEEA